jgi:AcrR family transcriptional regulator
VLQRSPAAERLVEAALDGFNRRGIAATPIDQVIEASGASVGSLYHHFGGKEGLAGELFLRALSSFQAAFTEELRRNEDAERGIRGGVRVQLDWALEREPELARFLLFQGDAARGSAPDRLREQNTSFYREVLAWWRPHVRYGALRDLDLDLTYSLWLGPAQQFARLRLVGRSDVPIKRAAEALADGAWSALREGG